MGDGTALLFCIETGSKDALASASARLDAGCDAASIAVVGETVAVCHKIIGTGSGWVFISI